MPDTGPKGWSETFSGSLFLVEQNEKGWEHAHRPPGTRTIILSQDGSAILLTKEVRDEHGDEPDYRLPGGKVADSWSDFESLLEDPAALEQAARAGAVLEVREEAGVVVEPESLELLDVRPSGGKVTWDLHYFIATDWHEHPEGQDLEEDEVISTEWVNLSRAVELILTDRFKEDRTAAVLLRFLAERGVIGIIEE